MKVSASKISSSGSSPCSSQASSLIRCAISSLRSAVFAIPTSSIVSAISAAPCALRERDDPVELVAAGLEVDRVDDRAAGDLLERGLDHLGLGRVDLDRRRLGQRDPLDDLAHLLVLVLALGQRDADVEHVGAALDLVLGDLDEAVVVVGEQQLLRLARALRVDPLADQRRPRLLDERRSRSSCSRPAAARARARAPGTRPPTRSAIARDVLGRRAAAAADDRRRRSARRTRRAPWRAARASRGRSSRRRGPAAAGPALGMQCTGSGEFSPRKRIASRMSSGPVEQLSPITSTSSAVERRQHRLDVGAEQHLAALRQQRDRGLDRQLAAGLA